MRITDTEPHYHRHFWSLAAVISWVATGAAFAGDWPHYRGPNHDGVSMDRINRQWTGSVTNAIWSVHLTNGLTSLAVSRGRVFTQVAGGFDGEGLPRKEYCLALSATHGAVLWSTEVENWPSNLYPGFGVGSTDDGPRSTPTIEGDSVYVLSAYLKLWRLNLTNGAVVWQKDLRSLYGGSVIGWQNAASPLVDNGLIFVNVNAGTQRIMALRAAEGSLAWRSQNEAMTHATPVLATIHGVRQLVFATQNGLVGLNPDDGTRFWRANHPFSYSTCLAVSPVVHSNMVFTSGAYGMGSAVTRVNRSDDTWTTTLLWHNASSSRQSHWMTPVAHNGFLYGPYGSSASSPFKCVELATGTEQWSVNNFGRGGVLLVNDQLLGLTERGALVLIQPSPTAYTELARFQTIPNYSSDANKCWNVPAVADGRVYVRSTAYAAAFDLSVPDLKLDAPQMGPASQMQLTVRTSAGTPVHPNRLTSLEVRATTNLALAPTAWTKLTNALVLTNGVVRLTNVDAGAPRQFFIVSEPK